MEKVIRGDDVAGLHQVCSCAILNLSEKSLGCMDFLSKETTVVLLVERRYNRECQTQLWSQSQSLFEIIGCAWVLKETEKVVDVYFGGTSFLRDSGYYLNRNKASRPACETSCSDYIDSFLPLSFLVFLSVAGQAFFHPAHTTVFLSTCPAYVTYCCMLPYHHFLVPFALLDST